MAMSKKPLVEVDDADVGEFITSFLQDMDPTAPRKSLS